MNMNVSTQAMIFSLSLPLSRSLCLSDGGSGFSTSSGLIFPWPLEHSGLYSGQWCFGSLRLHVSVHRTHSHVVLCHWGCVSLVFFVPPHACCMSLFFLCFYQLKRPTIQPNGSWTPKSTNLLSTDFPISFTSKPVSALMHPRNWLFFPYHKYHKAKDLGHSRPSNLAEAHFSFHFLNHVHF